MERTTEDVSYWLIDCRDEMLALVDEELVGYDINPNNLEWATITSPAPGSEFIGNVCGMV